MRSSNIDGPVNSSRFTPNETTNHAMKSQSRTNTFLRDKRESRSRNLDVDVKRSGYSKKFITGLLSRKKLSDLNVTKNLMNYSNLENQIHAKQRLVMQNRLTERKLVNNVFFCGK